MTFGLTWPDKEQILHTATLPVDCRWTTLAGEAFHFSLEAHHLIEADNLYALQELSPFLHNQVDLIYIDPPYNTGHKFIYSDRFKRASSAHDAHHTDHGTRHVSWLNMIYPRLYRAHQLLSSRGVIFISIDDHEIHHLTCLMNELWGEENHIATLIVSLNPKGRQLGRFATSHEYLLVYAKDISTCALDYALNEAVNPADFPYQDEIGNYRFLPLRNSNKRFNPTTRPTLYYPLYVHPDTHEVDLAPQTGWHEVYPVFGSGLPAVWRWSQKKVREQQSELWGGIIHGRLGQRWDIKQRDYNHKDRKKKLKSIWLSDQVGSTDQAAKELKKRGLEVFETPKPLRLMNRLLKLMPDDSVVLDFFAGTGTMGEATLRQNEEDGGSRRVILVQEGTTSIDSPKQNIATLTRTRLDQVVAELTSEGHPHVHYSRITPA